jgi:hypothetical protein
MQVDADILLFLFHRGLLPSFTGWIGNPECASHPRLLSAGGAPAVHNTLGHNNLSHTGRT